MTHDAPRLSASMMHTGEELSAGLAVATGRLDNGMELVVIPTRRSPSVRHMIWYPNGASDDPLGKSGIAHFLEHLMFKGTEHHPNGQFGRFLSSVGGKENAFTGWSYTCYHQHVPSEHLRACMAYEADRMQNLILAEAHIGPERGIVLSERGMTIDSNPSRVLGEAMHSAAFTLQSGGRPIIGWRHEIETLSLADARAYYDRFYRPDNAILLVIGDADPGAVMDMAGEVYGSLARGETGPERDSLQSPPPRVKQRLTLASEAVHQPQLTRLHLVPSPRLAAPHEAEALELLAHLLVDGRHSILYRRLVIDAQLAISIGADYWQTVFRNRTLFSLACIPAAGISLDRLEESLDSVIAEIKKTGFLQRDLDRAKKQVVSRSIFEQDNLMTRALRYGGALCCGQTLEDITLWRDRIEGVTVESLGNALDYLSPQLAISGHLLEAAAA